MSHKVSNAYTMFPISGGIWKICDTLPAELRDGIRNNSWNKMNQCFTYIHDYLGQIDLRFNDKGRWLIRMQNSAASCVIVCIISVITAKMTGILSIVCKQVAVCTVTAVMYMLAACFMIFGLTITHAKIADYITKRCYNLNDDPPAACSARIAEVGWSVAMGWVGAAFLIISFMSWAGLARTMRIEKSKIIL
ncbi:uncharacterized protein LOC141903081 [Tubulanus polymorphus]|uniref:uncharacterized protein LOC141903081 n=1 Tax=Tubulanus polymorphus TaxID=672921 RepID=UPI003DA1F697